MGASASFAQTEPVDFLMPEVNSSLGQPIQAQVNLGQLDVRVGVVSAVLGDEESFAAFGVQRYQVLDAISLDLSNNAAGDFILKVFTDQPVYEPSLRFVVDLEDGSGLRQIPIELLLPSEDATGQERRLLLSRPNDTLWRIANRTRDDLVTNDQQMLAVQRLNPQAFRASNINGLKPWIMLTLPLFEEAVMMSRRRAADDVAAQKVSWRLAQSVGAPPAKESTQDYGDVRITAVEEPEPSYEETLYVIEDDPSVEARDVPEYSDSVEEFGFEASAPGGEAEAALDEALSETAVTAPIAAVNEALPNADAFDLVQLEAQVREEEAGTLWRVLNWALTPNGIGILAALLLAAAILLLMLRRRAAQQEQALDDVLGTNDQADDAALSEQEDAYRYANENDDNDDSDREDYDSEDYDSEDYDSEDYDENASADPDDAEEDVYTTRLKLAEAYLEMGDEDGAEGMLEEVIADGSPEQQALARRILARLETQANPGRPENGDD